MGAGAFRLEDPNVSLGRTGLFKKKYYLICCPRVAVLGVHRDRVLLVRSSRRTDEGDRSSWLLPQHEVKEDCSIISALAVELRANLNLKFSIAKLGEMKDSQDMVILGGYTNTWRQGLSLPKYIVTVLMPIYRPSQIELSCNEYDQFRLVGSEDELRTLLASTRPVKQLGIYNAINRACQLGHLSWSCANVLSSQKRAA